MTRVKVVLSVLSVLFLVVFLGCRKTSPSCNYTLALSPTSLPAAGGQGTATVTPSPSTPGCTWTATSDASFLKLSGATTGSGQGTFTFQGDPNTTGTPRTVTIRLAWSDDKGDGSTSGTVTQAGPPTPINLSLDTQPVPSAGGTFTVIVTTTTTWSAASDQDFVVITAGGVVVNTVTGNGTVTYRVDPNNSPSNRTAHLTITGGGTTAVLTIQQVGVNPCSLAFSPNAQLAAVNGQQLSSTLTAGCAWTLAATDAPWISFNTPTSGAAGTSTVTYTALSNFNNDARTGHIIATGTAPNTGASGILTVDQASGKVVADFTVTKTSNTAADCEVANNNPNDPNARVVLKCTFNSTSTPEVFITGYKYVLDSTGFVLGTTKTVTEPKSPCGFPAGNTLVPLNVTLTLTLSGGGTMTKTKPVTFIKTGPC